MLRKLVLLILSVSVLTACPGPPAPNSNAQPGGAAASPAATPKQNTANAGIPTSTARPDEAADVEQDFEGTDATTEKKNPNIKDAIVMAYVRSARHEGFDRVVFEFRGDQLPTYKIEYMDKAEDCASGDKIPLSGSASLSVLFTNAYAHTLDEGDATIPMKDRTQSPNLPVVKDLKMACDFEAEVEWFLGVASRNKYRVLELQSPTRLVVDIRQ